MGQQLSTRKAGPCCLIVLWNAGQKDWLNCLESSFVWITSWRRTRTVMSRVANLIKWAKSKLSLKDWAKVVNAFMASIIYYHLIVMPHSSLCQTKLEHTPFYFLWKGYVLLIKCAICCQHLLNGELHMLWLLMQWHVLRLWHFQCFFDSEWMWSLFIRWDFIQLISLTGQQSWIKHRPRLGTWHLGCYQMFIALCQSGNTFGRSFTLVFYRGFVVSKYNNIL